MASFDASAQSQSESTRSQPAPIAVVELFTSEGCSSCPPADKYLRDLSTEARSLGSRVYALAFHVDYWNHLGWEDRFSREQFSNRQRAYAQHFDANRIYTPQMIVNGWQEFVGSNRTLAQSRIQQELTKPAAIEVELGLEALTQSREAVVRVDTGAAEHADLHLAVVERGLSTDVKRGENKGHVLVHPDVVRVFRTVRPGASETHALVLPDDLDPSDASVIAYLQDRKSLQVLGAAAVDLISN